MIRNSINTVTWALLILSFSAVAEPLITPVPEALASQLRSSNNYFVESNAFWAKQHRIVDVDVQSLLDSARLRIDLFGGEYLIVEATKIEERHSGNTLIWSGRLVEPAISKRKLMAKGMPKEQAEAFLSEFRSIRIVASRVRYDRDRRRKYQLFETSDPIVDAATKSLAVDWDVSASLDIWTDPANPDSARSYALRPFDQEIGHHLLVEVDYSKMYAGDGEEQSRDPTNRARREEHEAFLRMLGDDPSEKARERELDNKSGDSQ